ncbi:MAG: ABC transporter ATP-binding protein [Myxococcota bacterium]
MEWDDRRVLDRVDFDVHAGTFTIVVGPNGAGKSTLLDVLRGYRVPHHGDVRFEGTPIASLSPKERAARVGWLAQHPRVRDVMTVAEWLTTARFRFAETPRVARPKVEQALRWVDRLHLLDRLAHTLSGGEAQRVALAALMTQEARLWLLDEPTHHLDPAAVLAILERLRDRLREGQTMVAVVHDLDEITAVLEPSDHERVWVVGLKEGTVRFRRPMGAPDALADALSDLYDVQMRAVTVEGRPRFVVMP